MTTQMTGTDKQIAQARAILDGIVYHIDQKLAEYPMRDGIAEEMGERELARRVEMHDAAPKAKAVIAAIDDAAWVIKNRDMLPQCITRQGMRAWADAAADYRTVTAAFGLRAMSR